MGLGCKVHVTYLTFEWLFTSVPENVLFQAGACLECFRTKVTCIFLSVIMGYILVRIQLFFLLKQCFALHTREYCFSKVWAFVQFEISLTYKLHIARITWIMFTHVLLYLILAVKWSLACLTSKLSLPLVELVVVHVHVQILLRGEHLYQSFKYWILLLLWTCGQYFGRIDNGFDIKIA